MKKTILILIAIVGISYSCEDYLDYQPETLLTPEAALYSEEDVVQALNGVYSSLQKAGYFGTEFWVIADAATDNGQIPADREAAGSNSDRLPYAYTLDLTAVNTANQFWEDGYITIASVNNILERLDAVDFDSDFEDRVTAECLAIRAMTHFDMTKLFAQDYNFTADQSHLAVPYMKKSVPGTNAGRNTMAEVFQNAFEDINAAITILTASDGSEISGYRGGDDIFFVSHYMALGVRARMYFYMGDYANAKADSDEILTGPFTLSTYTTVQYEPSGFSGSPATFLDEWFRLAPVAESEAIFQLETDEDDGDFANRSLIDIYLCNDGNGAHGVSQGLLDLYEPADLRNHWFVDEPQTPAPDRHVYKYPGDLGLNADAHALPIMRLSEFILMSAECEARIGSEATALTLVNQITARANATAITSSGATLIDDIITERRKELPFEANRLFDLKRLQRGWTRTDCTLTNGNCTLTYPSNLYAWPIPIDEINANPVIRKQQNPGY